MKVFKTSFIDSVTRKEMVLADASYNSACWFLYHKLGDPDSVGRENDLTVIRYPKRNFYFDESRGYLLAD